MRSNNALNLAPFGRWTLRDGAAQRRLALRLGDNRHRNAMQFRTFSEMTSVLAENTPHALILDWWRRTESAINYFTIAYYGRRFDTSYQAITQLETDLRLEPNVAQALHGLRRIRNAVAHRPRICIAPEDATLYAALALHFIGIVGSAVPNDLALSSGAALVA